MVRILRPGGKILIADADEHNYEFLRKEQHDRWFGFKRENIKDGCRGWSKKCES